LLNQIVRKRQKDITGLIYTTNPIESFNRSLRKVSKNRPVFPHIFLNRVQIYDIFRSYWGIAVQKQQKYPHVSKKAIDQIKNPVDDFFEDE